MAINESNENSGAGGNSGNGSNRNSWKPEHEWDVVLPCGNAVFTPANKAVDSCKSADSICNMLSNCHGVVKNKSNNFTVYFQYSNKVVKVTGFLGGCKDLTGEEMTMQFNELKRGDVSAVMTGDEMEAEWNV